MKHLSEREIEKLNEALAEEGGVTKTMGYISAYFTRRELRLIANCVAYAADDPAGLPGHNLMMLMEKLIRYHGGAMNDSYMLQELIEMATEESIDPDGA